jgi:transposase
MPPRTPDPLKRSALQKSGTLHPHPDAVTAPLFQNSDFFDPADLVQVKYEMLRRVLVDHGPVSQAVGEFGFSRPVFYQAQAAFQSAGLAGLVPRKRGPRQGHKLTPAVLDFVRQAQLDQPGWDAAKLAQSVHQRFGVLMHPRTLDRGLRRLKKNR